MLLRILTLNAKCYILTDQDLLILFLKYKDVIMLKNENTTFLI